jgi:phospholipase C
MALYHGYASSYALADRYFQPIVGASSSNDMYLAVAKYVFTDNAYKPNTNGKGCTAPGTTKTYTGETTIADLLIAAGHGFAFYAMGYADMLGSGIFCPAVPADCTLATPIITPCTYDPSDNPFQYYAQFADNTMYMKDYTDLAKDLAGKTLPAASMLKAAAYKNEHPGYGTKLSFGTGFVKEVVDAVEASSYADDTLVLLTWDEGGGFFDHVTPPPVSPVDNQPYGTRVPLVAIGPFARKNHVSHTVMEHSSIVKFIEYNFLGDTGQLAARDAVVANIGSLLDPSKTGIVVPED